MELRRNKDIKHWTGEYANKGEYHLKLNPHWPYLPVYLAKLDRARSFLDHLAPCSRILDAGCGEGIMVREFARILKPC